MKPFKIIIKFLLVLLCMGTIFSFSSDNGSTSTKRSNSVIGDIIKLVKGYSLDKKNIKKYDYLVTPVRKSAHFIIYFILGLLVISLLREFSFINSKLIIYTIAFCFIYACSDEIHQLFINGRSGQVADVLLDTSASGISVFTYYFLLLKRKF